MYSSFLTAKDIMNHEYCPRITYFEHVAHIPQATTKKELVGRAAHQEFNDKAKRAALIPEFPKYPKRFDVFLEDATIGLRTVADCIIFAGDEIIVLQAKNSKSGPRVYRSQRLQLEAEALLVRRKFKAKVRRAFIKYLKDSRLIEIGVGEETERDVRMCLEDIKRIITEEKIPDPTDYPKKCVDCCYWNICRRV